MNSIFNVSAISRIITELKFADIVSFSQTCRIFRHVSRGEIIVHVSNKVFTFGDILDSKEFFTAMKNPGKNTITAAYLGLFDARDYCDSPIRIELKDIESALTQRMLSHLAYPRGQMELISPGSRAIYASSSPKLKQLLLCPSNSCCNHEVSIRGKIGGITALCASLVPCGMNERLIAKFALEHNCRHIAHCLLPCGPINVEISPYLPFEESALCIIMAFCSSLTIKIVGGEWKLGDVLCAVASKKWNVKAGVDSITLSRQK